MPQASPHSCPDDDEHNQMQAIVRDPTLGCEFHNPKVPA
jgi:hypothetical protein